MKTKLDIIKETRAYYEADPNRRAVQNSSCEYLMKDGRMCAVGRCMTKKNAARVTDYFKSLCYKLRVSEVGKKVKNKDLLLKKAYQGHSEDFWADLQKLHDFCELWNSDGLSESGEIYYNELIEKYS